MLYCKGNWNNNGTFSYNIGGGNSGTVQFSGTTKTINAKGSGGTGTGAFWNLTIAGGASYTLQSDMTVDNDLSVAGTLDLNGYTLTVNGNAVVTGTLTMGSGTLAVSGNLTTTGGTLNNNTGTVNLAGTFTSGTYNAVVGSTFNYNGTTQNITGVSYYNLKVTGCSATLADGNTVVNNTLVVDSTGKLNLSSYTLTFVNGASLTVDGEFGSSTGGTLTSSAAGSYYAINLNGVVNVSALAVNRPDNNGVTIGSSATISRCDNVAYTNGQNGAGSRYLCLNQSSGSVSLSGHNIDANCSVNVTAPNGIRVTMVDSSGAMGGVVNGELNDGAIDANITWTNPITWTGADPTNPTLWSVGNNWSTGSPPGDEMVIIIPNVSNQPTLDVDANCYTITIQNGATMTMSVTNKTFEIRGRELGGQLIINAGGQLILSGSGTTIKCGGTWTNQGTFTATNGTAAFHSQSIDQTIPAETFYNLSIDKPNNKTATAAGALTINGGLSVTAGTLNTGAYTHTVSGATDIYGTVDIASGGRMNCVGAVTVKAGGMMRLTGNATLALQNSLTVDTGATRGKFAASGATPTVTWYNSTRYSFTVNGEIDVTALIFDRPGNNGLTT